MSSIMRWRSGAVGLVMEYSRQKNCWNDNPDGMLLTPGNDSPAR